MKGKLIVIEGTDCSGKQTQSEALVKFLNDSGVKAKRLSFPDYDTPTGKIVGGPYLGKEHICKGFFEEGAANVDPKVASLYYAADRRYNREKILSALNLGYYLIIDRYVESSIAHQAGKILDKVEQSKMIDWLEKLEYEMLELPRPDMTIFLHMPHEASFKLREGRTEKADQHEADKDHIIHAENTYLLIAKRYSYSTIECVDKDNNIKSISEISKEVQKVVLDKFNLLK